MKTEFAGIAEKGGLVAQQGLLVGMGLPMVQRKSQGC